MVKQTKVTNLLDEISNEDLIRFNEAKAQQLKVYPEDLLEAEFALKFGWQAYKDMKADEITGKEMMKLIIGSRKLEMQQLYRSSQAAFIGAGAAKSRKPGTTFKNFTRKILKLGEADK